MIRRVIDIYSKGEYPADELSNFFPHEFVIDGVQCASMEGFLQSLKYKNAGRQRRVCALVGKAAKAKGRFKFRWKLTGKVYWQGQKLSRFGAEYFELLLRAYTALSENARFAAALEAAGDCVLCHSLGKRDKKQTILTEQEFIACLNTLRQPNVRR